MQPTPAKSPDPREAIDRFLKRSRQPVLMEPGEDPLPIAPDRFILRNHGETIRMECWSDARNLVRRLRKVRLERRGRLELEVERFGGRTGILTLIDLADPSNRDADRRGARLKYRERFRRSLHRQFPDWRLAELSTEPDLNHSLSPSYPRALLRKGAAGLAAIGAAEDALSPEGVLSFGLIWLDYLRRREPGLSIQGLAVFVPAGAEGTTCHRVRYLNPKAARFSVFVHAPGGHDDEVDPRDYTNFDTKLDPCCQPLAHCRPQLLAWVERIAAVDGVQRRDRVDGSVGLAVRGLEFARTAGDELRFGLDQQHVAGSEGHVTEIGRLAEGLAEMRHPDSIDRMNPLYTRRPEAWLESQIRGHLESIDAMLQATPVYGQVPQFAAGDRGVIDLLAVDCDGRLAVIEVKAGEDIHLPLQALDYWMRVKWHLDRDEFSGRGYFPGIPLRNDPPRLLLVAPALDYHPSNETVLRYLSPEVEAERFGVGLEWKRDLKVMFRARSAPSPRPCPSLSFVK